MKSLDSIRLDSVQAVYGGPEGDLWELVMGQQIHIGGFQSSMDLAKKADLGPGMTGVDLCCCNGAGMRFLLRFRNVDRMIGVDATPAMIERGCRRCREEGLADRVRFVQANACETGLAAGATDFVWGEDAWCYVEDKAKLIAEARRLTRPGGKIAFTDWVEGPAGLSQEEAARYLAFMKFPSYLTLDEYVALLRHHGCEVLVAEDTGRFASYVDLYLNMLQMQLTYDALKIIGFDMQMMEALGGELEFVRSLAHAGKIAQGLLVARKK